MASIYKRSQDKGKKRTAWYFNYTDYTGKQRTRYGFTDKKKTEQLATAVEQKERQRKLDLIDPAQERLAAEKSRSMSEHIADYEKSLEKRTEKYKKLVTGRVKLVVETAEFKSLADVTVFAVEAAIQDICKVQGSGHQTFNHYVDACFGFGNWLKRKAKRVPANPFDGIEKLNAQEDVRHPRRALTAEEFSQLVQSARSSGVPIQCYDGETRARIYIMSYLTGLRRKELASLTPASFSLDASQPMLTVEAAHSKHRRKDKLPLHPELVGMLRLWLVGIEQDEPLFPKLAKRRTYKMVKLDLERAGIPYETPDGIADFYAAGRHTHITELLRNGASLVEARTLARHSDIKMTMKYTHIGVEEQARALQNIPTAGLASDDDGSEKSRTGSEDESEKSWECPGSESGVTNGQSVSSDGNEGGYTLNDETPVTDRGYHQNSSSDNVCQKWRRRESNPLYSNSQLDCQAVTEGVKKRQNYCFLSV